MCEKLFDGKALAVHWFVSLRFGWLDCLLTNWLAFCLFELCLRVNLTWNASLYRCVTCNILLPYDKQMCMFVVFSSFAFASYIISRFMGVWKLYCLAGWLAGSSPALAYYLQNKLFAYTLCNLCLLLLLSSLPRVCVYECTVIEYLYRDRCNNRLFDAAYCIHRSLLFHLIRFVSFVFCFYARVCLYVIESKKNLNSKYKAISKRDFSRNHIVLVSWSSIYIVSAFVFVIGLIPYSSRKLKWFRFWFYASKFFDFEFYKGLRESI